MPNFKERIKPATKVEFSPTIIPYVVISDVASKKMSAYVDECNDEIGWLGTAYHNEEINQYSIEDVFLFKQKVHATTTEIDPEGLQDFGMELLQQEGGMDIYNAIRMWGHSHVKMAVTPSGQDDKQMKEFSENGQDWFIRLIANKLGEIRIDLYHYKLGLTFLDIPWYKEEVVSTPTQYKIQQLKEQYETLMSELQKDAEAENKAIMDTFTLPIKEEIKEKVSKLTYASTTHVQNRDYATAYGRWRLNEKNVSEWKSWAMVEPSDEEVDKYYAIIPPQYLIGKKKPEDKKKDVGSGVEGGDRIASPTVVYAFFNRDDLLDLGSCVDIEMMIDTINRDYGYKDAFSANDYKLIWTEAQSVFDEASDHYDIWNYNQGYKY